MVEVVVRRQIQISNDLVSSGVMCRSQVHWNKIFGLDEDDTVFVREGDVHFGNPFSILSVGRWSISLPEFKGEVLKGVTAKVPSFDRLS